MKLTITPRSAKAKGEIKQIRRKGNIPAVVYAPGEKAESIEVNGAEFGALVREIKAGHLPTSVFTLVIGNKEVKAIIKDIQYNMINYKVSHIDFEKLSDKVLITVNVPVTCAGIVDCVGIKLGGFLRQVYRTVSVECLPGVMPKEFVIDIRELGIGQSRRLSDIPMPKGVKPLEDMKKVLVVIGKQRSA